MPLSGLIMQQRDLYSTRVSSSSLLGLFIRAPKRPLCHMAPGKGEPALLPHPTKRNISRHTTFSKSDNREYALCSGLRHQNYSSSLRVGILQPSPAGHVVLGRDIPFSSLDGMHITLESASEPHVSIPPGEMPFSE